MEDRAEQTIEHNRVELIGDFFKEHRERQHLSIREVSRVTKINATMIETLEANQFSSLPNKAYVIGYVKSYSKILNVDAEEALAILERNYNQINNVINPPQVKSNENKKNYAATAKSDKKTSNKDKKEFSLNLSGTLPFIIGFACVAIMVVSVTVYKSNTVQKANQTITKINPTSITEDTPLQESTPEAITEEHTKKVEDEKSKLEPKKVTKKKDKKKDKKKIKKEHKLTKVSGPLFSMASTSSEDKALIPRRFQKSISPSKQNIYIAAKNGNTWMTYKKDNEPIKQFQLKKGKGIFISGKQVRVFIGNINATRIFLNNEKINTPSASGVKSLVFPKEDSSLFKLPLFIYKTNGRVITSDEYEKKL